MLKYFLRSLLGVGWAVVMPIAQAQTASPSGAPQGLQVFSTPLQAFVPLNFQSVMTHYRPYSEQAVGSWAEANRTVEKIGGWRAYAKEASQPGGAPAPVTHEKGGKP